MSLGSSHRRTLARSGALLFLCGALIVPSSVLAASASRTIAAPPGARTGPSEEELSSARKKFQKALALQTGGDWAGALALLKEVAEIKSTPQVLFNIALCEENLGQLVAALGDYELAAADARAADLGAVEVEALGRLEQLRTRIPRLRIERGPGAARATVTLGGVELGEAALGREMPVDPGTHEIRAVTPGRPVFTREVRLEEGESATVTLTFEVEEPPPPPPVQFEAPGTSTQKVLGYVSGGIGLAGLAAAGVFYVLRHDAQNELDDMCPTRVGCPERGRPIAERGREYAMNGNIALGVGLVGVATAAVLWLTDSPSSERPPVTTAKRAPKTVFSLGHASAPLGATVHGTF